MILGVIAFCFAIICFVSLGIMIDGGSKMFCVIAAVGGLLFTAIGMKYLYDTGKNSQTPEQQKIEYQKQIDYYQRKLDKLNLEK